MSTLSKVCLSREHKALVWLAALNIFLFLLAGLRYPGSILLYELFTFSATYMLWFSLTQNLGFGQRILGIFLWLGIFFKLAIHLIFQYNYVEPIGEFVYTQYDEALAVGIVAYTGVCAAWLLARRYINPGKGNPLSMPQSSHEAKSNMDPIVLLGGFIALVLILNAINIRFGILRVGLVSETIFFRPTNFMIDWLLSVGISFAAAVLLLNSCLLKKHVAFCLVAVIFAGVLSGATVLSRGVYLWSVFPIFLVAWVNQRSLGNALPRRKLFFISIIAMIGFIVTGTLANVRRDRTYLAKMQLLVPRERLSGVENVSGVENAVARLGGLAVDRWLGWEGILVAVGHSGKSLGLFKKLLEEKSAIGYISRYQFIADAINYTHVDANKFQFNTLPGPAGFFYLSGSFAVVFLGMFLVVMLGAILEHWVYILTRNPFLYAIIAVSLADMIAQMGVAPRNLLKILLADFIAVVFIAFVQSRWWGIGWFSHENSCR